MTSMMASLEMMAARARVAIDVWLDSGDLSYDQRWHFASPGILRSMTNLDISALERLALRSSRGRAQVNRLVKLGLSYAEAVKVVASNNMKNNMSL
mmetsp:Transcript_33731/g.53632  ORF Transcript_33731/g.53632 Transcript_33731/m.53632 type:complete len:96 (-) Transcript_33731:99-386(-)|eukprot:CAMPEP_0169121940 /NCGR_PEP_ID=MMETSP1015-20121227/32941_1 /TAXON_ID=342587 /ORGANISM="Karlodinium micrum, Strain CCMP2283" /LENGTH=95 /DNA_ID=CAMNT_0009185087 /DNA_START=56 /DNA_END=343 /DNA_ORIENTATION=+